MLGGPLEISNFVRRESELVALPDQKLAGEQQPLQLKCNVAVQMQTKCYEPCWPHWPEVFNL